MRPIQFHQIPQYIHQGITCFMILIGGLVAIIVFSPLIIIGMITDRPQKHERGS